MYPWPHVEVRHQLAGGELTIEIGDGQLPRPLIHEVVRTVTLEETGLDASSLAIVAYNNAAAGARVADGFGYLGRIFAEDFLIHHNLLRPARPVLDNHLPIR